MNESLTTGAEILVVDDERASLEAFTLVLSRQGYRVRSAGNGEAALQAVRESPPDLILLDICMPGMNGYTVCEWLKADERTRDIPVIFTSALNEAHDRVRAFSAGGVDYVTKPMWVEEMLARVVTHLALRATRKQLAEKDAQLQREIAERKRVEEELGTYRDHLEEVVSELTAVLRRLLNAMTSRELRIAELQGVIRKLLAQLEEAGLEPAANDPLSEQGV
jgi:CheY-like chemotaxis protein